MKYKLKNIRSENKLKRRYLIVLLILICLGGGYLYKKNNEQSQNIIVNSTPPMLIVGDVVSKNELDFTIKITSSEIEEISVNSLVKVMIEKSNFNQQGEQTTKKSLLSFMENIETKSHIEILLTPTEVLSDKEVTINSLSNIKIGGKWIK